MNIQILSANSPKWLNQEHTLIELNVEFSHCGTVPFTASQNDIEPHGVELFNRASMGEFGTISEYTPPQLTPEQIKAAAIKQIDNQRDIALTAGFMFNGQLYHCDPIFQTQVQAYLAAWREGIIAELDTVSIRRKDNVTIQMTKVELLALAAALMTHVQVIYAQSWAAKDAL